MHAGSLDMHADEAKSFLEPLNMSTAPTLKKALCQTLAWRDADQISLRLCTLTLVIACRSRPPDMSATEAQHLCHEIKTDKRPFPQVLTCLSRAWFIPLHLRCPFLRECWRGPKHFWSWWVCLGYEPAPAPTLKKALYHTLAWWDAD